MKNVLAGALLLTVTACAGRTAYWETDSADSVAESGADASALSPGDEAWSKRSDQAQVLAAIATWEKALGCTEGDTAPEERCGSANMAKDNAPAMAKVTRAYYFWADSYLRADDDNYLDVMNRGVWWGERALAAASPEFAEKMGNKAKFYEAIKVIDASAIEGAYWYATCLGKWAKRKSFAVLLGQKDNIKATMERVLELDPKFFHSAPHRYFGAFYAIAPGFAGGDPVKSEEHFKKSLDMAPYYVGTKVLWAEHLATKQDDEETFKRLLNEVLEVDPTSGAQYDLEPEVRVEQQKARELLENIDEYF
jgi:hypothetical protein